jgi:hypothetical protein
MQARAYAHTFGSGDGDLVPPINFPLEKDSTGEEDATVFPGLSFFSE